MRSILRGGIPLEKQSFPLIFQERFGMDIRVVFGQVLQSVRKEKGIAQERLALEAGLDRSYISKLENGAYQPSLSTIIAIAKILDCRPGDLVDLVEEEMNKQG